MAELHEELEIWFNFKTNKMSSDRTLAHVEQIKSISLIEGADQIVVCEVLGWKCVIRKDEFKVGDKIVYTEIDTILPPREEFKFMEPYNYHVKTAKKRGQVSQGIVFPMSILPKGNYSIGQDVTEILGITKYLTKSEREEFVQIEAKKHWTKNYKLTSYMWKYRWFRRFVLPNKVKNEFPEFFSKTDEARLLNLNLSELLEIYKDDNVYISEKVDYQSGSWACTTKYKVKIFGLNLFPVTKFIVCSRNLINNDKNSLYWQVAKKYDLESICKKYAPINIVIQGEQGNTNVQGNKYGISEPKMWIFNIIMNGKFLNRHEMEQFCNSNNLDIVPLPLVDKKYNLKNLKLSDIGTTYDDFVNFVKGKSVLNPKVNREGIVFRIIKDGKKVLSFKVINSDFLLKYDDYYNPHAPYVKSINSEM